MIDRYWSEGFEIGKAWNVYEVSDYSSKDYNNAYKMRRDATPFSIDCV